MKTEWGKYGTCSNNPTCSRASELCHAAPQKSLLTYLCDKNAISRHRHRSSLAKEIHQRIHVQEGAPGDQPPVVLYLTTSE
jgi:hypothetical protein